MGRPWSLLRPGFVVGLALAGHVVPAGAARVALEVRPDGGGRPLLRTEASLEAGEERRFVRRDLRVAGKEGSFDLWFGVSVTAESPDAVQVELNGIVRATGAGVPVSWTARSFVLHRGETASFRVDPAGGLGLEIAARIAGPEALPGPGELGRVKLKASLRLTEGEGSGARLIEERRLRLVGPEATEVVLESPGPRGPETLRILLWPRARRDSGVVLELLLEAKDGGGEAARSAAERLELGWDDVLRIAAMRGPAGPLLVELKAER